MFANFAFNGFWLHIFIYLFLQFDAPNRFPARIPTKFRRKFYYKLKIKEKKIALFYGNIHVYIFVVYVCAIVTMILLLLLPPFGWYINLLNCIYKSYSMLLILFSFTRWLLFAGRHSFFENARLCSRSSIHSRLPISILFWLFYMAYFYIDFGGVQRISSSAIVYVCHIRRLAFLSIYFCCFLLLLPPSEPWLRIRSLRYILGIGVLYRFVWLWVYKCTHNFVSFIFVYCERTHFKHDNWKLDNSAKINKNVHKSKKQKQQLFNVGFFYYYQTTASRTHANLPHLNNISKI